jgi:Ser/Thr protein kinase RdoA (MazF antagonist)
LEAYDLADPQLEFLRHNENLTFKVTARRQQSPFLLRIHSTALPGLDPCWRTPAAIESELLWIEAIARDTNVTVQQPVRTRTGETVSSLEMPDGQHVLCTLLRWIDGEPFPAKDSGETALARQFGLTVAALHAHGSSWRAPPRFHRPAYNTEFVLRAMDRLRPGVEEGLFAAEDLAVLGKTVDRIGQMAEALGTDPTHWGLIHADMDGSNMLVHDGDVSPIDFSLCGFGHFCFDLSICVAGLGEELRGPFLEGYTERRELGPDAHRLIEAFAIVGIIACCALHIGRPESREWLTRRMPVFANEYARSVLDGKPYLLDD